MHRYNSKFSNDLSVLIRFKAQYFLASDEAVAKHIARNLDFARNETRYELRS